MSPAERAVAEDPGVTKKLPPVGLSLAGLLATLVSGAGAFAGLLHAHEPLPAWVGLAVLLFVVYWEQRLLPGLRERAALRSARSEGTRLANAVRTQSKRQKSWIGTDSKDALEKLSVEVLTAAKGMDIDRLLTSTRKLDELAEKVLTRKPVVREYVEQIGGALLAAALLRAFFYEAFRIPSSSMVPTLLVGDHLFVNKFIYGIRVPFSLTKFFIKVPARGDIVVFNRPGQESGDDIIKRVIGLPGDRVTVKDRHVTVNGVPFETHPLPSVTMNGEGDPPADSDLGPFSLFQRFEEHVGTHTHIAAVIPNKGQNLHEEGSWIVEPDHVFVMGDNRDNSEDSRFGPEDGGFGQVPLNYIKGRADVIWMSLGGSHGLRFSRMFTLLH